MADYEAGIKLAPKDALLQGLLATFLATCKSDKVRNGDKAVKHARIACDLTERKESAWLDALAQAYAEKGDFPRAIKAGAI